MESSDQLHFDQVFASFLTQKEVSEDAFKPMIGYYFQRIFEIFIINYKGHAEFFKTIQYK